MISQQNFASGVQLSTKLKSTRAPFLGKPAQDKKAARFQKRMRSIQSGSGDYVCKMSATDRSNVVHMINQASHDLGDQPLVMHGATPDMELSFALGADSRAHTSELHASQE